MLRPLRVTAITCYGHYVLRPLRVTAITCYGHYVLRPLRVTAITCYGHYVLRPLRVTAITCYSSSLRRPKERKEQVEDMLCTSKVLLRPNFRPVSCELPFGSLEHSDVAHFVLHDIMNKSRHQLSSCYKLWPQWPRPGVVATRDSLIICFYTVEV